MKLEIISSNPYVTWDQIKIGQVAKQVGNNFLPFIKGFNNDRIFFDWSVGKFNNYLDGQTFEILGFAKFTE